jgi:hypothetical protein
MLAHLCNITGPVFDGLDLADCAAYIDGIDSYLEAKRR